MRKYLIPLAASAAFLSASQAYGAQTSANFQARISISTSCTVSATSLDFGPVGIINGGETATSAVNVNCSSGTLFDLSFDPVLTVTAYNGTMVNGPEDVAYSAALSLTGGTGGAGSGLGGSFNLTIDGLLPVQVSPPSGIYTDNRVLYVNF